MTSYYWGSKSFDKNKTNDKKIDENKAKEEIMTSKIKRKVSMETKSPRLNILWGKKKVMHGQ